MKSIIVFVVFHVCLVTSDIRKSLLFNKLINIQPVGKNLGSKFVPLTEIPPPRVPHMHSGRRHLDPECTEKPRAQIVYEGPRAEIFGEYYDDKVAKTMATVIIPDHIDRKHFEVTTQVPYLTVGTIGAIGYHPSTIKGDHPSECEKIYQDHLDDQYSEEDVELSEESLEMARLPVYHDRPPVSFEDRMDRMYSDMDG